MNVRTYLTLFLWAIFCSPFAFAQSQQVTVTGQGAHNDPATARDIALEDAYRKAVEQASGVLISSKTQTEDFVVIKDVVLTRSSGFVTQSSILKEGFTSPDSGIYEVTIQATVSLKKVADTWAEIETTLARKGYPKLMVVIGAQLGGRAINTSQAEVEIGQSLTALHIDVFDRSTIESIKAKKIQDANLSGDISTMAALGMDAGVDIVLRGKCEIVHNMTRRQGILNYQFVTVSYTIQAIKTDTGAILAQHTDVAKRRYVSDSLESAAHMAILQEGRHHAKMIQGKIFEAWVFSLQNRNDLQLTVTGCSFKDLVRIKKALGGIRNVSHVSQRYFRRNTAQLIVKAKMSGEELAERLLETDSGVEVDILGVTRNEIEIKVLQGK